MKIPIPFVGCEVEIIARRRTEPIRIRLRTLMILTALAGLTATATVSASRHKIIVARLLRFIVI